MPWSNQGGGGGWQGGGGGRGPWGQGPQGGGGGGQRPNPPDLEELLRKGQDRLKDFIPGGGGGSGSGGPGFFVWGLIVIGIIGIFVWNGLYRVQPDSVGIELLFGRAEPGETQPGLHYVFWPIETVETVPALRQNETRIGTNTSGRQDDEGLMLTGDQNIVDIEFTVLWRIADPRAYLFNISNQEQMVRVVAESAMRDVVGRNTAEVVRTTGRAEVQDSVQNLIQRTLDSYGAGIQLASVNIERADPPTAVADAFEEVQRAKQDQDKFIEDAQKYSNRRLGEARGEAAQLREEAEGYKGRVVADAQGASQRFLQVYEEYKKAEDVTRKRLFLETMESVLGQSNKVIIEEGAGGSGVVPYLPLPEVQKQRSQSSSDSASGNRGASQ
ncbi:FtsH protease activity modulator HflK [Kaustia mangrovi]|uniref:Protein HflK n=1 Tax=Kaustia mangrovi TaxID=2593653 RepID=A0A7S8HDN0_9HYPH|nr:FtsH protease activity modulator HflK [Kaustia mangrovi]QPC44835.1 FtsH protease activity modulator HflK [Kaustia mangrovi]